MKRNLEINWSRLPELNRRPSNYESDALPTELSRPETKKVVQSRGANALYERLVCSVKQARWQHVNIDIEQVANLNSAQQVGVAPGCSTRPPMSAQREPLGALKAPFSVLISLKLEVGPGVVSSSAVRFTDSLSFWPFPAVNCWAILRRPLRGLLCPSQSLAHGTVKKRFTRCWNCSL